MVIDQTLLQLRRLCGGEFESIAIDGIVIGVFFTGVKLSNGIGGVGYTPTSGMHEIGCCTSMATQMSPVRFKGMKAAELVNGDSNAALTIGVEVTDVDEILDLLAEGAGAYCLFTEGCVRKINIFRE